MKWTREELVVIAAKCAKEKPQSYVDGKELNRAVCWCAASKGTIYEK